MKAGQDDDKMRQAIAAGQAGSDAQRQTYYDNQAGMMHTIIGGNNTWYGGGGGYSTTSVNTLTIGTLGLDTYDPSTKQLIWRGVATKTLDTGAKPGKRQRNMTKAIAKLLKNFPPPVKKKKD